jgi:hypothetical protein
MGIILFVQEARRVMDRDGEPSLFSGELARYEPGPVARDEQQKLLMQTLSEAQVDFLLQRTPRHEIKTRQGRGGLQFSYVEHGYVTERLNLVVRRIGAL